MCSYKCRTQMPLLPAKTNRGHNSGIIIEFIFDLCFLVKNIVKKISNDLQKQN